MKIALPVMDSIDWTFSAESSARAAGLLDVRKYHWYPATFIPELPYTLIEILTHSDSTVWDPFAGIGTTIIQGASLGRRIVGTEVCRVAVEFARDLWDSIAAQPNPGALRLYGELTRREYVPSKAYRSDIGSSDAMEVLEPWFAEETMNELHYLAARLESAPVPTAAAARIALSAALKAVSAQDRGWGCVADNVLPKPAQRKTFRSALDRFVRNMGVLDRDLTSFRQCLSPAARDIFAGTPSEDVFLHADARMGGGLRDESIDVVVTSPPYPEMTDYCMAQRLSYYLQGEEPEVDLRAEIGARRKRFRRTSLDEYGRDMERVAGELQRIVRRGGYVCLVMPQFSSSRFGQSERTEVVSASFGALESSGFLVRGKWNRLLPTRRRHHNQKWTSLTEETIILFEKIERMS